MSLESVTLDLSQKAPDLTPIISNSLTSTVEEAARVHQVIPDQIAKTLAIKLNSGNNISYALIVMAGTKKLNNKLTKAALGARPRFLNAEEVLQITSHPPGGVCPFGLPQSIPVFCDESLKDYPFILPAAGATNASVKLSPQRLVELTNAQWVNVSGEMNKHVENDT